MVPEFSCVKRLLAELTAWRLEKAPDILWQGSLFGWLSELPLGKRERIGQQLVAGWCAAKGLDVTASGDSEADRVIGGRRMEIKFSTLWKNGLYVFQQIRDQDYEYAVCLGVSPFDAHCWVVSRDVLRAHVIGHTPQHRGRAGTDTFRLRFPAAAPPAWLSPCGGKLTQAFQVLRTIARR